MSEKITLTGCIEFSCVEGYQWWTLVGPDRCRIGCYPYRGWKTRAGAQRACKRELARLGFDVKFEQQPPGPLYDWMERRATRRG